MTDSLTHELIPLPYLPRCILCFHSAYTYWYRAVTIRALAVYKTFHKFGSNWISTWRALTFSLAHLNFQSDSCRHSNWISNIQYGSHKHSIWLTQTFNLAHTNIQFGSSKNSIRLIKAFQMDLKHSIWFTQTFNLAHSSIQCFSHTAFTYTHSNSSSDSFNSIFNFRHAI